MTGPWRSHNAFGQECTAPKNGKWSKEEAEKLVDVIRECCANRQVDSEALLNGDQKIKGIWEDVAKSFPHRPVNSVYRKGLRVIQSTKNKTGPWSEIEKSKLLALVTQYGKKWAKISTILGRSGDACFDKYRTINWDYESGPWSDADIEKLLKLVEEYSTEEVMPWTTISKRMGNRNRLSCFKKWKNMYRMGIFAYNLANKNEGATDPWSDADTEKLKKLVEEYSTEEVMPWTTISERMGNRTLLSCFRKWKNMRGMGIIADNPANKSEGTTDTVKEIEKDASLTINSVCEVMKKILNETPKQCMNQKFLRRAVKARYPAKKGKRLKKIIKSVMQSKTNFILDGDIVTIKKNNPSSQKSSGLSINAKTVKKAMKKILRKELNHCMNLKNLRFALMLKTNASSKQEIKTIVRDVVKKSPFKMEEKIVMLCKV